MQDEGHRLTLLEGKFCLHRLTFNQAKDVNSFFDNGKAVSECPQFSTNESYLRSYKLDMREVKKNERNKTTSGLKAAKFLKEEVEMFQDFETIYMGKHTKNFLKSLKEEVKLFDGESLDDINHVNSK